MAPPPAKRQKRLVVLSSDDDNRSVNGDEDPVVESLRSNEVAVNAGGRLVQPLPARPRRKLAALNKTRPVLVSSDTTPTSSPEKAKKKPKTGQQKVKSKSLYTFFTTTTQTQRLRSRSESRTPELEEEDYIEDDSLDEDLRQLADTVPTEYNALDRRKARHRSRPLTGQQHDAEPFPNASQKFLKAPKQTQSAVRNDVGQKVLEEDRRPWAEKYAPTTLEELAVHKKKVADVRTWLENVLQGRSQKRLLILKGPSGTGKTTTLSLLGSLLGFTITEWRNPVGSELSSESFVSMSAQFEDFLGRSGRFGSLDIFSGTGMDDAIPGQTVVATSTADRKNIVLLEEFPNTFTRSSTALDSFRSALLHYLGVTTASLNDAFPEHRDRAEQVTPIIMIISETLLTTSTAVADSFTAHRLLGPRILTHPAVSIIDFNPIAPTFITKALDLVVQKEARKSGRRRTPGPGVMRRLGAIGDVRSAVSSLEFLCLRGDEGDHWSGRIAGKSKRSTKDSATLTRMETESLEMVTRREATLGIFHAVGKVVYNKREDVSAPNPLADLPPQPRDHMSQHVRAKTSQVSIDALMDETGTDTQTFIAALHENYILSCGGPSTLDSINGCIDALSDCDLNSPDGPSGQRLGGIGRGLGRGASQGAATDSVRQGEICFQIGVRGILFSLPYPVKRTAQPTSISGIGAAGKGDAFKMFYPTSLRLWRRAEEIESLVDNWINRSSTSLYGGEHAGSTHDTPPAKPGSVETWKSNLVSNVEADHSASDSSDVPSACLASGRITARQEMILERLPYVTQIHRAKRDRPTHLRDLEKITQFRGLDTESNDDDDDVTGGEDEPLDHWTTDQPAEAAATTRKRAPGHVGKIAEGFSGRGTAEKGIAGLVLSDDDIEDG